MAGKPPWWRWYEPPRWFPAWLHALTCTYCRGMNAYVRRLGIAAELAPQNRPGER